MSLKHTLLAFGSLLRKEILATLKERTSRAILVAPILVYVCLFGYIATFNLDRVPYALCDLSRSAASNEFVHKLEGNGIFERVATLQGTTQIAETIDAGEAMLVVTIGPDFARNVHERRQAPVQVIVDGRNSTTAQLAVGYVSSIAQSYNADTVSTPVSMTTRTLYNPNAITQWFIVPGLIVMLSMMQVIILSALSVAREREQETFEQLQVTPYSTTELILAKAIIPIAVGLFQGSLIFLICRWWFEIPLAGSVAAIYAVDMLFLLAVVGLGLSISAYSKTMQQALLLCFVCLMPMILLSGFFSSVENMPDAIQYLTYLDPLRFALAAVRRIYLAGADFWTVLPSLWPMITMAAVTLSAAYHFFKKRL